MVSEDTEWVRTKNSKLWLPKKKKLTGFEDKTHWDRLQLYTQVFGAFSIPLTIIGLIIGIWQFNTQQQHDAQMAIQQERANQAQALDQQRQTVLDTYLDRMSDLLGQLSKSQPTDEVRVLARARTLAALRVLDPARKAILLKFLYESGLINSFIPNSTETGQIIDLDGADLSYVDLNGAQLSLIDLNGANLAYAQLAHADLNHATLTYTTLTHANLSHARLDGADLSDARLDFVNLNDAYLPEASFENSNLSSANLSGADLFHADLTNTIFNGADLSSANLYRATVTNGYLDFASSLKGAILPDGSKHP